MNLNKEKRYQVTEETVKWELTHLRRKYDTFFKQTATVKSWCITIWIAILIATMTGRITPDKTQKLLILVIPVVLFWLLEAIYASNMTLLVQNQMQLEERIAKREFSIEKTSDIFVSSRFTENTFFDKCIAFLRAFFTFETIVLFYSVILLTSVVLVMFM